MEKPSRRCPRMSSHVLGGRSRTCSSSHIITLSLPARSNSTSDARTFHLLVLLATSCLFSYAFVLRFFSHEPIDCIVSKSDGRTPNFQHWQSRTTL